MRTLTTPRLTVSISNSPCSDARTSPRFNSRIDPSASTTTSPATQWRVTPYLNVAAPAAFGRDGPADEGAVEGWRRRIVEVARREETMQFRQRHTGASAHGAAVGLV